MKFTINRTLLADALEDVGRGLSTKTPMPILTGIKIDLTNESLILTTSNKEVSVQVTVTSRNDLVIEKPGICVIPGKYFTEAVKRLDGTLVEFEVFDETTIKVVSERSDFTLVALDAPAFPQINFTPNGRKIELKCRHLKKIINQTVFAAGTSESRITLTGVSFQVNDNNLEVIATDSYRLSKLQTTLDQSYEPLKVIIPAKPLEDLSKILDDDDSVVAIFLEPNKATFAYKNIKFLTRLIEGSYPETGGLFPKESLCEITFNKASLQAAVDRVSLFITSDPAYAIRLSLEPNNVVKLMSTATEMGRVVDEIIPLNISKNNPFQLAFRCKNLYDALNCMDSQIITLRVTGEIKPFTITGDKEPGLVLLILPVRLF